MPVFSTLNNIDTIIWDWNGTLFNDTKICIESINRLLSQRGLKRLTLEKYHEVFDFPVKDYYLRIGFDFEKEPFEVPANQFIDNYFSMVGEAKLHHGVENVLQHYHKKGITQLVLSAAEQQKLEAMIDACQITGFFKAIKGLDHDYATSKVDLGIEMLAGLGILPERALLVGDTYHDYEVATEMGCKCLLVSNGHHPYEKLLKTGAPVVKELAEVKALL